MNHLLVTVTLIFLITSCNKTIEYGIDTKNEIGKEKPFTGKIIETYLDGTKKSEKSSKDGKLNGVSKQYYENGDLLSKEFYKDGKLEGVSKVYYKNGKIHSELNYKNGKPEGVSKEYYENGDILWGGTYYGDISPNRWIKKTLKYFLPSFVLYIFFTSPAELGFASVFLSFGTKFATFSMKSMATRERVVFFYLSSQ